MGFIAALLLMLMTEDEAFWCLCHLLDGKGKYKMRGLYLDGLPLLHCRYYQFDALLLKFMPKVFRHLKQLSSPIEPALYASKWFITIFCYEFPFTYVLRLWDIYLHEGIKFVFRVSLALMKMNEAKILSMTDFESMMKYLQRIHCDVASVDLLLQKAFALPLKHVHLEELEDKYDRKCLAKQRRSRRDVSEYEQPIFIQRLSQTSQTPAVNATPSDTEHKSDPKDLNAMYAKKLAKEKADDGQEKEVAVEEDEENEEEEKKEDGDEDEECNKYEEGSHSASSELDEEPSSLHGLPSGKSHEHEAVPPTDATDDEE